MTISVLDKQWLANATSAVVKRSDFERLIDANDVLALARESAAQQHAQLEAMRQQAMQAGHAAGVELGKQDWARYLTQSHVSGQIQLRDMQATLVDVVMRSLHHLLGELPPEPRFEMLAKKVMGSVMRARQMRLVVAAADVSTARKLLEQWQRDHPEVVTIDIVVDDALTAGDCILETEEGAIDGRLSQRLKDIGAALAERLSSALPPAPEGPAQ